MTKVHKDQKVMNKNYLWSVNIKLMQMEKISRSALLEGGEYSDGVIKGYNDIKALHNSFIETPVGVHDVEEFISALLELLRRNKKDGEDAFAENDYHRSEFLRGAGRIYTIFYKTVRDFD